MSWRAGILLAFFASVLAWAAVLVIVAGFWVVGRLFATTLGWA